MTLDAMHWVWKHARSTGNARVVLLAVADAVTGPAATAPMGNAELRARLGGVSKSTVTAAVAKALESGELEIAEPGKGSRAALYRLPGAVGFVSGSAPESGAQTAASAPIFRAQRDLETATAPDSGAQRDLEVAAPKLRPENQGTTRSPTAPESGAQTGQLTFPDDRATRAQASSKDIRMNEGVSERPAPAVIEDGIPAFARPLVDTLTASGVIVRWDLGTGEWLTLDAMIQRSGTDLLAAAAVRAAAKTSISHARYLLRAWRSLPPAPAAGTAPITPQHAGPNVVPFDPGQPRRNRAQRTADELALILAREAQQ